MLVLTAILALLGCGKEQEPGMVLEMNCEAALHSHEMEPCYQLGVQALKNARPQISRARGLFSKGCNVHHAPSCDALAEMVRDGRGGPRDVKRAAELFEIGCRGEVVSSCVNLGLALYEGKGVKEDDERAVELFRSTCEADPPQARACEAMGRAYKEGKGVEAEDLERAEALFTKACDLDFASGCVKLGSLHAETKRGTRAELQERLSAAAASYERACKIDARFGCYELATFHAEEKHPEPDPEKAAFYYQKTCNIDPTRGCFEAAELMNSGKVTAREGEIESLYNLACEHGHTEACSKRSLD